VYLCKFIFDLPLLEQASSFRFDIENYEHQSFASLSFRVFATFLGLSGVGVF